jgi:hypothetical protein
MHWTTNIKSYLETRSITWAFRKLPNLSSIMTRLKLQSRATKSPKTLGSSTDRKICSDHVFFLKRENSSSIKSQLWHHLCQLLSHHNHRKRWKWWKMSNLKQLHWRKEMTFCLCLSLIVVDQCLADGWKSQKMQWSFSCRDFQLGASSKSLDSEAIMKKQFLASKDHVPIAINTTKRRWRKQTNCFQSWMQIWAAPTLIHLLLKLSRSFLSIIYKPESFCLPMVKSIIVTRSLRQLIRNVTTLGSTPLVSVMAATQTWFKKLPKKDVEAAVWSATR